MASWLIQMPEYFIGQGTLVNAVLVFIGGFIGSNIGYYIPQSIKVGITQSFGIFSFGLAYYLFKEGQNVNLMWVLFCIILGGGIGYLFDFESMLDGGISKIFRSIGSPEGFNVATILFCVGPVTIIGCVLEATKGQNTIIFSKAIMDGISSILLSSSMGKSVAFSSISILLYQGALTYGAFLLKNYITNYSLHMVSFVGACIIVVLGLRLLGLIKDVKLLNFILSPVIAIFIR